MTGQASRSREMGRWLWAWAKWGTALVVIGAIIYWIQFSPLSVSAHSLRTGEIVADVMGTGTLEARVSTTISPKISGRIEQVFVDQGDTAQKGKLLVQLDDEELRQQVAIAEANVDAANAGVVRLKADKDRANAVFEQARLHHARTKLLNERAAASLEDVEKAAEALAVAVADITRSEAAITEGEKELIAAERTLEYHRARFQDTRIESPFDGLILARHREAGDVAVPGSAILTLVSTDVLWISAWVDETAMAHLSEGQIARVVFRSQTDKTYPGKVVRLGKQADRETREFLVDVQLMQLPASWAIGQRAEVYIETARKSNALLIDTGALARSDGAEGVFVNNDGYARWRPLELGLRSRDAVEVISGLNPTDTVISPRDGAGPLVDGDRVRLP